MIIIIIMIKNTPTRSQKVVDTGVAFSFGIKQLQYLTHSIQVKIIHPSLKPITI